MPKRDGTQFEPGGGAPTLRLGRIGTMIITCPNCRTKYDIADKALGDGRKVLCAHCQRSWRARPEPQRARARTAAAEAPQPAAAAIADTDELFGPEEENELDIAFSREEATSAKNESPVSQPEDFEDEDDEEVDIFPNEIETYASSIDDDLQKRRQREMAQRQKRLADRLPMARIRRAGRFVTLFLLFSFLGGGFFLRTDIVRAWPDLGGLYEAIGLGVNVVGLDFDNMKTLRTLRDGRDVLVISATIRNVAGTPVAVPPVLVSILDDQGTAIYEWTAQPQARIMGSGETVAFETQLNSAPQNSASVNLVFANASKDQEESGIQAAPSQDVGGK